VGTFTPGNEKPVLVWDGECGFCRIWVEYWKHLTGDRIDYAPFQEVAALYPQVSRGQFAEAVRLILPSGRVLDGAHAVFQTLAYDPRRQWLLHLYERFPIFKAASDAAYKFIARHRPLLYQITRLLFGLEVKPLSYSTVQWLFLKLIGLIYVIAFASFGVQAAGLIGSHGIQPASLYLTRLSEVLGGSAYRIAPSLLWLASSDTAIRCIWIGGIACGCLILAGIFWRAALFAAFLLYLSLVNISQEFLSYQWDFLLLESGFLAIFIGYSEAVVWLFRWLLFRLVFMSGAVKLLSGDPAWRSLTALTFHYQTQPLPTPLAWYAQQLPVWFHKVSCAGVFFIELLIPILILLPRRARLFALPWILALQILILLTGNYAFFNLLTMSLCIFLVHDAMLARVLPGSWIRRSINADAGHVPQRVRTAVAWSLFVVIGVLSGSQLYEMYFGAAPAVARSVLAFTAPFGISNGYGLFQVMTTRRPEIIVEGSNDGTEWREYEFKYKPGRVDRPPPWVAPHQPRLDWQMWFAALGSFNQNVWFLNFLARLLQGTPEVLELLDHNPFPGAPPKVVRARLYEYAFTNSIADKAWWTRTPQGLYLRAVSLEDLSVLPLLERERQHPSGHR
jgi:predicted DCC family thiol-disulfide oxidoreductase YuxK